MNRTLIYFLLFHTIGLVTYGQDNPITKFDLYGCWIWERNTDGQPLEKRFYKRCEQSDSKLVMMSSEFSILAFNKAEIQTTTPFYCFGTIAINGTWAFDSNSGILQLFYPKDYLVEMWEHLREARPELEIPNPPVHSTFRIIKIDNNSLEVEKIRTTKLITNIE